MSRIGAVFGLALAMAHGSTAFAACQIEGTLACGTGSARIASAGNELQVSRGGAFAPLPSGSSLQGGDRVLAGANGATLSLGPSCSLPIQAGSLVSVARRAGQVCANVAAAPVGTVAGPDFPIEAGLLAAGGAAALGVGIATTSNGGRKHFTFPVTVSSR